MNITTEKLTLHGAAGNIQALRDVPGTNDAPHKGIAVIAHPHPLFGGTMDNKVVQTMARAFVQAGWSAIRFNFRGVGLSAGEHDGGVAETQDMLAVIAQTTTPETPLCLAGFSFGAYVTSHVIEALGHAEYAQAAIKSIVLVGTATSRFTVAPQKTNDRTFARTSWAD